jgi:hypothetical protein
MRLLLFEKKIINIIFEFLILFSKFLFLNFDFSKKVKVKHETKIIQIKNMN